MFAGKDIDYSAATIRNDGFWPDVAVADFERRRALPADLDQQTTGAALLAAVSEINL
ncbi:TPA: head completion/stabilization protein, partial [Aeromonas dhakensis]|nr:head completion/stabilization protein [Aeromonas dhakensis]